MKNNLSEIFDISKWILNYTLCIREMIYIYIYICSYRLENIDPPVPSFILSFKFRFSMTCLGHHLINYQLIFIYRYYIFSSLSFKITHLLPPSHNSPPMQCNIINNETKERSTWSAQFDSSRNETPLQTFSSDCQ